MVDGRQKAITGTKAVEGGLQGAPEPSRDIFIYRARKHTTENDIMCYLKDDEIETRSVKKVSNIEARFDSFKVEIIISDMVKVLLLDFWPEGVCVRRFHKPRNDSSDLHSR